jgi:hypothetical protein
MREIGESLRRGSRVLTRRFCSWRSSVETAPEWGVLMFLSLETTRAFTSVRVSYRTCLFSRTHSCLGDLSTLQDVTLSCRMQLDAYRKKVWNKEVGYAS